MKIRQFLKEKVKGRPKPLVHKNGLRKNGEEYGKGGKVSRKKSI